MEGMSLLPREANRIDLIAESKIALFHVDGAIFRYGSEDAKQHLLIVGCLDDRRTLRKTPLYA